MSNGRITYLIDKFHAGDSSREELMELFHLLEKDPGNKVLLADVKRSFQQNMHETAIGDFQRNQIQERLKKSILAEEEEMKKSVGGLSFNRWMGYAAAVLILLVGGVFAYTYFKQELVWQEYTTKIGERKKIQLPDKSTVFLNGNSSLRFSKSFMKSKERVVELNGEAYFSVQGNVKQPFYVISPAFTTRVLGTSFNVDTELDKTIAVKEGKVQVLRVDMELMGGKDDLTSYWENGSHDKSYFITLHANEQAHFSEGSDVWEKQSIVEFNDWVDGKLFLFNKSLPMIAAYLSRYYGQKIIVDKELNGLILSITINNKPITSVMNILSTISNSKLEKEQDNWYLKKLQ